MAERVYKVSTGMSMSGASTVFTNLLEFGHTYKLIKLSRGEICVANLKAPCEWCEFGQVYFGPIPWQAAEIIGGLLATE